MYRAKLGAAPAPGSDYAYSTQQQQQQQQQQRQRPLEVINLADCRATVRREEHEMLFESVSGSSGSSTVWLLQASNEHDLDQWVAAIDPVGRREAPAGQQQGDHAAAAPTTTAGSGAGTLKMQQHQQHRRTALF